MKQKMKEDQKAFQEKLKQQQQKRQQTTGQAQNTEGAQAPPVEKQEPVKVDGIDDDSKMEEEKKVDCKEKEKILNTYKLNNDNCSIKEYRKASMLIHPDKNPGCEKETGELFNDLTAFKDRGCKELFKGKYNNIDYSFMIDLNKNVVSIGTDLDKKQEFPIYDITTSNNIVTITLNNKNKDKITTDYNEIIKPIIDEYIKNKEQKQNKEQIKIVGINNTNKRLVNFIIDTQQNSITIIDYESGERLPEYKIKNMKIIKDNVEIQTSTKSSETVTNGPTITTKYNDTINLFITAYYSLVRDEIHSRRLAREFINKNLPYTYYVWNFGQNIGDALLVNNKIVLQKGRIGTQSNYYKIWDEEYKNLKNNDTTNEFTEEENIAINDTDKDNVLNGKEYNSVLSQDQINSIREGRDIPEEHEINEFFAHMENNIKEKEKEIGRGTMSLCNKLTPSSGNKKVFSYNDRLNTLYWKDDGADKYEDKLFIDDISNVENNKLTIKTTDCDNDIDIQYENEDKDKWILFFDKSYKNAQKNKSELVFRRKIIDLLEENREKSITYTEFIYLLNDKKDNVDTVPIENNNVKLNIAENRVGKGSQVEVIWNEEYKALYGKEPDYTKDEIEYFSFNNKTPKWKSMLTPSYLEVWRKSQEQTQAKAQAAAEAEAQAEGEVDAKAQSEAQAQARSAAEAEVKAADAAKAQADTAKALADAAKAQEEAQAQARAAAEAEAEVKAADAAKAQEEAQAQAAAEAQTQTQASADEEAQADEDDFEMIDEDIQEPTTTVSYTPYGFEIIIDFTKFITKK